MSAENTTHWSVTVSRETDIAVRTLLARRGLKEGDLSGFIEETLKWRFFDQSLTEARSEFADLSPEMLQELVNEATDAVRNDMRELLVHSDSNET